MNGPSPEFRKSVFHSLTHLTAALKAPQSLQKIFSTFWHLYIRGTNIRCASKHRPGHKTTRECTVNHAVDPAVDPAVDSAIRLWQILWCIIQRGSPQPPQEAPKICHAKQLQTRMHVDANIHSWEYNKPACQTLIFLSVQISTQL